MPTKSRRIVLLSVALFAVIVFAATASAESGKLEGKVVAVIKANAAGKCPADLLGPVLLDQCEQQIDRIQARLSSLGSIEEVQYKGIDQLPNGMEVEVYKVSFQKGHMLWLAAGGGNGKLNYLWSPG